MKIAVVGRGHVGGALSRGLSRAGHEVIAVDRDERAVRDAAERADVVILAVPFAAAGEVARVIEPVTAGKPVMDVTNALTKDAGLAVGFTTSGGEELQKKLPRAHVVKALNTVFAGLMETGQVDGAAADGVRGGRRRRGALHGDGAGSRHRVRRGERGTAQERTSARAARGAQRSARLRPWLWRPGRVPAPARRRRASPAQPRAGPCTRSGWTGSSARRW